MKVKELINTVIDLDLIEEFLHRKETRDLIEKGVISYNTDIIEEYRKRSEYHFYCTKINEIRYNLGDELLSYSAFPTYLAKEVFSVLLTYVEGESFVPYTYYQSNLYTSAIVIKEKKMNENKPTSNNEIEELCKNGDLVILDEGTGSHVHFYDRTADNYYNFNQYNYLEDFLHELIQYRIDNSIDEYHVNENHVYEVLVKFLDEHQELRLKNKEKRDKLLQETNNKETLEEINKIKSEVQYTKQK